MSRSANARAQFYSLAGVAFYTAATNNPLGIIEVPGTLELPGVSGDAIDSRGGFSDYPVATRPGVRSGEAKLTINECPSWLEQAAHGGTLTSLSAAAGGTNTSPTDVSEDTGLAGATTITVASDVLSGMHWITAEAGDTFSVESYTERGRYVFTGLGADGTAKALSGLGVSVAVTAGQSVGRVASFTTTAANSGGEELAVAAHRGEVLEYSVRAWSVARKSPQDALVELTLHRVVILGLTEKLADNEAIAGAELSLKMLAPANGGAVWSKKKVSP